MKEQLIPPSQRETKENEKRLASLAIEATFALQALMQNPKALAAALAVLEKKYGPQLAKIERDKRDLALKGMTPEQIIQFKEDLAKAQEKNEELFSPAEIAELEGAIERATETK